MDALTNTSYDYSSVNCLVSENTSFCYFLFLGDQGAGCGGDFYVTICNADSFKLYFAYGESSVNKAYVERGFSIISDFDCQFQTTS